MSEIEVTINDSGDPSVLVVSTLEDLWHDYQHFYGEALKASSEEPALEQKRYLRAALVFFVAYCGGVVDQWCRNEFAKQKMPDAEQKAWLSKCLEIKCDELYRRAKNAKRVQIPKPHYEFKKIRNWIIHVQQGGDLSIYHDVTPALLRRAEAEMTVWFKVIGKALGHERHTESESIVRTLAGS